MALHTPAITYPDILQGAEDGVGAVGQHDGTLSATI
jgi:hypothetical protein